MLRYDSSIFQLFVELDKILHLFAFGANRTNKLQEIANAPENLFIFLAQSDDIKISLL
jgi:hypothetical protein